MGNRSGEIPSKITKTEMLDYIRSYSAARNEYPTADDIAEKLQRSRKVIAQFLSRYARYGIVEPFKKSGEKTRYGPGPNWIKVDHEIQWSSFFRAGICPSCKHKGVLGMKCRRLIRYRCKWCLNEWTESIDWANQETIDEIERQRIITERQSGSRSNT